LAGPWQVGHLLNAGGGISCSFPFSYTPPAAGLRPSSVGLSGGAVQLNLNGYAVAYGAVRCVIIFGSRPSNEVLLDPAEVVHNVVAPPVDLAGVAPVAMNCAGGVGRLNLGVLLEYVEGAHAETDGRQTGCALFAPCSVRVQLANLQNAAAAGGLRALVASAVDSVRNSSIRPAEPDVEVYFLPQLRLFLSSFLS
jgi:hypothetical protein